MPRILPRLRQAWDSVRDKALGAKHIQPPISPRPQKPSSRRLPAEFALASLSVHGRTESLLLDKYNAVQRRRDYRYKRSPAPRVYGPGLVKSQPRKSDFGASIARRRMTDEEKEWWSSPYRAFMPAYEEVPQCLTILCSENAGKPPARVRSATQTRSKR